MIADCFMAVDIGTGSTRAALITGDGRLLAQASQEYPLDTPAPGWAEQDPRIWWRCTVETIRRVLDESEITPRRIACVGIDSQMHATIPLDAGGDVLVPAVQIWHRGDLPERAGRAQVERAGRQSPDNLMVGLQDQVAAGAAP